MNPTIREINFSQEVLSSSVPVLVHFWAPWCGICRMITPLLNRFQEEYQGQLRIVDVNADESLRLASYYQLTTLPTLIFFRNGEVLKRIDGFSGRDDIRQALDWVMRQAPLEEVSAGLSTGLPLE
ncbi:thioredoxin [Romeria aff. gracilis LEGE 07310]|uniref:Thioredoxin n=1 Tax=Vasconcelosia minhoensis LEGE 07310 TaxID=915328 RepID=A0A8J7AVA9_9CYAN|nr:thioredoxin domain-containing protein [Romeria gracilis]MBE9076212.1 thioredoxin [Romeria aff. gracilis LEGE 07310]